MKEAIQKAIEGGYNKFPGSKGFKLKDDILVKWDEGQVHNHFLLDPLFWQCLGKALGWNQTKRIKFHKWNDTYDDMSCPEWKYHWHRFIDHLAEGKDADSFFKTLNLKSGE